MEQIKTIPTFTNCVSGALGLQDVVIKILGSLSYAFAYSSSICVLGTEKICMCHQGRRTTAYNKILTHTHIYIFNNFRKVTNQTIMK